MNLKHQPVDCIRHDGSCVLADWDGGGQPSGLLSFPCSKEGQEENHGGGAAGRCRVPTVSQRDSFGVAL